MLKRFLAFITQATKRYFIAGILLIAPLAITAWSIYWLIVTLDRLIVPILLKFVPGTTPESAADFPPFVGLLFAFAAVLLAGVIARDLLGHEILRVWERLLTKVPIAGRLYGAVRQLFEAIAQSGQHRSFRRVVLVEYPRKGVYALAFVSRPAQDSLNNYLGKQMLSVFLPTTPNPTSGFYLLIAKEDVIDVALSIEDAFKLIMSAGLVSPASLTPGEHPSSG